MKNNIHLNIKGFIARLDDVKYFFGIFVTSIAFISAVLTILSVLKVDLVWIETNKRIAGYIIFIHCVTVGFISLYYRKIIAVCGDGGGHRIDGPDNDSILASELISSLKTALNAKKYLEVIRVGSALSKPFFSSGNYRARLSIGLLVEEAAAITNDEKTQMAELIDSIGWMSVELGDLDNGEKYIQHGLQYALKNDDKFYISKANRHLGAICRRRELFQDAEKYYDLSLKYADEVIDNEKKIEAIAATKYALALLYYHIKNNQKALASIDESVKKFADIKYIDKITMANTLKAQILFALDKIPEAKDLYRVSLNEAEKRTLRMEMVRCYIGLTRIYLKEKNYVKADEYLEKSDSMEKNIQSASELAEITFLRSQIPSDVGTAKKT